MVKHKKRKQGSSPSLRYRAYLESLVFFFGIIALWEISVRGLRVPQYILPGPIEVGLCISAQLKLLIPHSLYTLQSITIGYFLSIIIAVPLALLVTYSPFAHRNIYPLIVFSQLTPKTAIVPLLIIWFGFGLAPKIITTFLVSFFPIIIDAIVGFKSVPQEMIYLVESMGASELSIFSQVRLPFALPNLFAGLKVGTALATVGAVVAEFVGSDRGLGYLLLRASGELDTKLVFAALITLSFMGLMLYFIIELIERIAIPWHISRRKRQ